MVANLVEGGYTPILTRDELSRFGFRLVISPGMLLRAFVPLAEHVLRTLREEGSTLSLKGSMIDLSGINARLGLDAMLEAGRGYAPD